MNDERLYSVRGAIQVSIDDEQVIEDAVRKLCGEMFTHNSHIDNESAVSIMFTQTSDLTSLNPATALRKAFPNIHIPLFCMQELSIRGMLPRTIRIMIQFYAPRETKVQHVYLEGARSLRPDLANQG